MQTPGTQKQEKILKMGKLVCIAMMILYSMGYSKITEKHYKFKTEV
jgi:hypothetical protein